MFIDEIKDKYKGQNVWIIGKGPSLQFLKKEDISDGVVITLNEVIIKIEEMDLPNPIYSMQKDVQFPENCRPKNATLLVHQHESLNCFPDYKPRYVFDNLLLGLQWYDFSALSAIKIAELMGCNKFYFVSFDACVNGDCKTFYSNDKIIDDSLAELYKEQCQRMQPYLDKINYEWITPK